MSTILEYQCGCQYYSDRKIIEPAHLCTEHKIQAFNDALQDFMKETVSQSGNGEKRNV